MVIDINKDKQEHRCKNCRYDSATGCNNPYFNKFINEALRTGRCKGFEKKEYLNLK